VVTPSPLARAAWLLGLTAAYVAAARIGLALDPVAGFATLVWPPTGIALAALVRRGLWLWPAVAAGAFVANLWGGASWVVALGIALGNTLEALIGARLLRGVPGHDGTIRRVRDAFGLLIAALLSPVISASVGALSLTIGGVVSSARMPELWQAWWLGDVLGNLVVAPFLLNWSLRETLPRNTTRAAETAGLALATLASAALCFSGDPMDPLQRPHMVFPVIVWAAVRFGPSTSALTVLVISGIAIGLTVAGVGPFVAPTLRENLTALQGFMGIAALTSLFLAAINAERSRAERILAEQHARLHAITEASPGSIFVKDLQGRYVFVNPAHGRLLGREPEAVLGKRDDDFFGEEVAQRLREGDRLAVRSEHGRVCEEVVPVRGESRTLLSAKAPYRIAGELSGNIGIAYDITEQKNVERQLQQAVQARDEFLSIAGHELRTPLSALTLQVTGLQRTLHKKQAPAEDNQRELERVDRAVDQLRRLSRLVDELLDVARISAGRLQLRRERFDLSRVVREIAASMGERAARIGSIVQVTADAPVMGDWDRQRIEHIVATLLMHALKYGAGKPIELSVEATESMAVLCVRDHGTGIAPEEGERIFDRFTRGDSGDSRKGLGVGLYAAQQVVQAHGGAIRVESSPGSGCTFVIELPQ